VYNENGYQILLKFLISLNIYIYIFFFKYIRNGISNLLCVNILTMYKICYVLL